MNKSDFWVQKNFERLVQYHPGQWAVIVDGQLIGISKSLPNLAKAARKKFPQKTPTLLKIPRKRDLICALSFPILFFTE